MTWSLVSAYTFSAIAFCEFWKESYLSDTQLAILSYHHHSHKYYSAPAHPRSAVNPGAITTTFDAEYPGQLLSNEVETPIHSPERRSVLTKVCMVVVRKTLKAVRWPSRYSGYRKTYSFCLCFSIMLDRSECLMPSPVSHRSEAICNGRFPTLPASIYSKSNQSGSMWWGRRVFSRN